MRGFILKLLSHQKPSTTSPNPTEGQCLQPSTNLSSGLPVSQKQCLLFDKLSTEIRLQIYEDVLADPIRLLHFLHVTPGRGRPTKLGHWRCEDMDSPYLTWQHVCFGCWKEEGAEVTRNASHTNGDLLSLLLTCRSIYTEAVDVLYSANHFSFRGARGLLSFRELIAPTSWNMLRHVNVSTSFLTPMKHFMVRRGSFPQENYLDWQDSCSTLASLPNLHRLRIEMMIWDELQFNDPKRGPVEQEALVSILSALKHVQAQYFTVELNLELPNAVKDSLGDIPFELLQTTKLFDRRTFRL